MVLQGENADGPSNAAFKFWPSGFYFPTLPGESCTKRAKPQKFSTSKV
jgi:hypothetical protein